MANAKTGLNYYAVDTDRYQDRRIKRLKKDLGCQGIAVYDYILCEVYRVQGCFLEWDENTAFDVAEYFGLKENSVHEIVQYCGSVGLFEKELLSRGIISSASIQRRYLEMCSRAKRKIFKIPEECRIVPEESDIVPEESQFTPEECTQSKVKESKVNTLPPIIPPRGNGDLSDSEHPPVNPNPEQKNCAKRKALDLSCVEPTFQPIVADWLAYKSERGQTYRQRGFEAFYSELKALSGGSADIAQRIVRQSMANNWAGIFEPKNQSNERTAKNIQPSPNDLARAVAEGISRANTRQEWEL